jgi:hypothetical protein
MWQDHKAVESSANHWNGSGQRIGSVDSGAMFALLPARWCRPVLTAVARCHLSGEQCLPDSANARTPLASMEVLAVDAARGGGGHVCQ